MGKIAFAWELGAGFGHVANFLSIGRVLKQRGHDVVLILRELHDSVELCKEFTILQAPLWLPNIKGIAELPLSYADILLRHGYHEPRGLIGVVEAWKNLLRCCGVETLILSHAPTAALAAHILDIPFAWLGTGFEIPPGVSPLPNMRPWLSVPADRLQQSEAIVLNTIDSILIEHDLEPLEHLYGLFDGNAKFLCTFPELDHYPNRAGDVYYGPTYINDIGEAVQWPSVRSKRVFVYLRPTVRDWDKVMDALATLDCSVLAYVPGIAPELCRARESEKMSIFNNRLNLTSILGQCDLAVSYAGHSMVSCLLMTGVPALLLPFHLEQFLLATRIQEMGCGVYVNPDLPPPDYAQLLAQMLADNNLRSNARTFAHRHADHNVPAQTERIATEIETLLS